MYQRPNILFLINPKSGTKRKKDIDSMVKSHLTEFFDIKIAYTEYAGHATILAKDAANEGFDTVVAVGGDGTVNEVAQALIGSKTALYIVPMGSGNGLARHLHIPLLPQKAMQQLPNTVKQAIDVGIVNEKFFFCTAGLGFEAHVSHVFAKQKSRGLTTYAKSSLSSFFNYKPHSYEIKIDGQSKNLDAFMVTVANVSQFGNNFFISPQADAADGYLDLCIVKPLRYYQVPTLVAQAFGKQIHKNPNVEIIHGKKIEVFCKNKAVIQAHIDGEPIELPANVCFEVLPQRLNVRTFPPTL